MNSIRAIMLFRAACGKFSVKPFVISYPTIAEQERKKNGASKENGNEEKRHEKPTSSRMHN